MQWKLITLPEPVVTENDENKALVYSIDLENYEEFATGIFLANYGSYGMPVYYGYGTHYIDYISTKYDYRWDGLLEISPTGIVIRTAKTSNDINIHYFMLDRLRVR